MTIISIITINYNNKIGLEATIRSVQNQTATNYEHIVIDGNSVDGSKEIIENNKDSFSYWVSEPDNGVYHAMNKGIKVATGIYVFFLNSGDEFIDRNVLEVFNNFALKGKDIYFGDLQLDDGHGNKAVLLTPKTLSFEFFFRRSLPHQSAIIKRELFDSIFYYTEAFKIISDWEFFAVAMCQRNCSYEHVGITVANYDTNGVSSRSENKGLFREEKNKVLLNHFPLFVQDYREYKKIKGEIKLLKQKTTFESLIRKIYQKLLK
ncbi:MAG: glycosyltransferase family 2 protein [Flavobacteriaceae bacterium]